MVSPFEIIALAETITGVGDNIYQFFSNVKDAPEEIREFCVELELLMTVLGRIRITSNRVFKTSASSHQAFGFETIFVCLRHCNTELNTLWLAVSPLRSDRGLGWGKVVEKTKKSVSWVVKADEIDKAARRLDKTKQTLVLGISLSGIESDAVVVEGLSSVQAQVEANSALLISKAEEVQGTILASLQQFEHRLLERVEQVSSAAETQHWEGELRISQLAESFTYVAPTVEDEDTPASSVHDDTKTAEAVTSPVTSQIQAPDPCKYSGQALPHPANIAPELDKQDQLYPTVDPDSWLSPELKEFIQDESAVPDLSDLMNTILGTSQKNVKKNIEPGISRKLGDFITSLSHITSVFEAFDGRAPEYLSLVWGSMRLVLKAASQTETHFAAVVDALAEMQYALGMCEREYRLYPEQRERELFEKLCKEMVEAAASNIKTLRGSTARQAMKGLLNAEQQELRLKNTSTRIKNISEKVIREVEYFHRRELREAHQRLREVDRKQDEALRMLKEQQRILMSLQDEQRLLAVVADHQKVLQLLQRLLARHK